MMMQHPDNPFKTLQSSFKMKDSRLPKNSNSNFFQNYANGLWYVPGPELENVCQNSNTLYCLCSLPLQQSPGFLGRLCSQIVEPITSLKGNGRGSH